MHSNKEPNCLFGGMAIHRWESDIDGISGIDPADQCSWLFKMKMKKE